MYVTLLWSEDMTGEAFGPRGITFFKIWVSRTLSVYLLSRFVSIFRYLYLRPVLHTLYCIRCLLVGAPSSSTTVSMDPPCSCSTFLIDKMAVRETYLSVRWGKGSEHKEDGCSRKYDKRPARRTRRADAIISTNSIKAILSAAPLAAARLASLFRGYKR